MGEHAISIDLWRTAKLLCPEVRYFDHDGVARVVEKMPSFAILPGSKVLYQPFDPSERFIVDLTTMRAEVTRKVKQSGWFGRTVEVPYSDYFTRYVSFERGRHWPNLVRINYQIEYGDASRVRYHPYVVSPLVDRDFGTFHQEFLEASGLTSTIEKTLNRKTIYAPGPIWFREISAEATKMGSPPGYALAMNGAMMFEDEVELLIDDQAPIP